MATLATGLLARFGRAGLAPAGFHLEVSLAHFLSSPSKLFPTRYAGELEVRPPGAPTTSPSAGESGVPLHFISAIRNGNQEPASVVLNHSETDAFAASTRATNACNRGDGFPFFQIRLNGSRTSISTTGSNAMPLGHCHRVDSVTQAIPIWH